MSVTTAKVSEVEAKIMIRNIIVTRAVGPSVCLVEDRRDCSEERARSSFPRQSCNPNMAIRDASATTSAKKRISMIKGV